MSKTTRILATVAASVAVISSVLAGWAATQAMREVQALRAVEPEAETAVPDSRSEMVARAAAAIDGEPERAVILYRAALAAKPSREERFAIQLGLARAFEALGDGDRARESLRSALVSATSVQQPEDLLELGSQALEGGALREARRIFYALLALEDRKPAVEEQVFAEAQMLIGDSLYDEANGDHDLPEPGASGSWTLFLEDVDLNAQPSMRVQRSREGLLLSLQCERAEARLLFESIADQAGLKVEFPESWEAFSRVAITADLRQRPLAAALTVLAGVAGLELEPRGEQAFALRVAPARVDEEGRRRARELAAEAYTLSLARKGSDAPHAHLLLAEIDRADEAYEQAIGRYRALIAGYPDAPELPQALMGLGQCELALLRGPRARDPLLRLINETGDRRLAPDAFVLVAESYLTEGRDGEAEKTLRHLLRAFPACEQATRGRLMLGAILVEVGKLRDALEVYKDAAEAAQDPRRKFAAGLEVGKVLLAQGEAKQAVGHMTRLIGRATRVESPEAYLVLGQALHTAGDHLAALFAMRFVVREFPQTASAHTAEGLLPREAIECGLLEQAETALAGALLSGVEAAQAFMLPLADAWLAAGDARRALAVLNMPEAQGRVDLTATPVVLLRARCYAGLDPRACLRTLRALDRVALAEEQRAEVARLAGDAHMALGRHDLARQSYQSGRTAAGEPR